MQILERVSSGERRALLLLRCCADPIAIARLCSAAPRVVARPL